MKSISSIILSIRGREWTFMLLSDKQYDKLHNPDADLEITTAMTVPDQYEVHFRKSDLMFRDIKHELGHVFKHMTGTKSAELTVENVEELFCEIIADYSLEINVLAERIQERFQAQQRS